MPSLNNDKGRGPSFTDHEHNSMSEEAVDAITLLPLLPKFKKALEFIDDCIDNNNEAEAKGKSKSSTGSSTGTGDTRPAVIDALGVSNINIPETTSASDGEQTGGDEELHVTDEKLLSPGRTTNPPPTPETAAGADANVDEGEVTATAPSPTESSTNSLGGVGGSPVNSPGVGRGAREPSAMQTGLAPGRKVLSPGPTTNTTPSGNQSPPTSPQTERKVKPQGDQTEEEEEEEPGSVADQPLKVTNSLLVGLEHEVRDLLC